MARILGLPIDISDGGIVIDLGGLGLGPDGQPLVSAEDLLGGLRTAALPGIGTVSILDRSLADAAVQISLLNSPVLGVNAEVGGFLGTLNGDVLQLDANSVLGSASLGLGGDIVTAAASSVVNGIIDTGGGNDNVQIGAGDATLNGGAGDDRLTTTGDGDNVLNGGAGADHMSGGLGDDTYIVDHEDDQVVEGQSQGNDTVLAAISYTLTDHVENLVLIGSGAFDGRGNEFNNAILGNAAKNSLYGLAGDDRLDGGAGDDDLYGGDGDDRFVVGSTGDRVFENAGEGYDRVYSSVNHTLAANLEELNLQGAANLNGYGNELDNTIRGTSGANTLYGFDGDDILDAGAGIDRMYGGLGNDRFYVDEETDRVVEDADAGFDNVYSSINYTLGVNVEQLKLTGGADLIGRGNELDNLLIGNTGANTITGREGADQLRGMEGNDLLNGDTGDDRLLAGTGDDVLEGDTGRDDMTGDAGADSFVFRDGDFASVTRVGADRIRDFTRSDGDQIDLHRMDANTLTAGNGTFRFIGADAFGGNAGELRAQQIGSNTFVFGDTDGDRAADFALLVDGQLTLVAADFWL